MYITLGKACLGGRFNYYTSIKELGDVAPHAGGSKSPTRHSLEASPDIVSVWLMLTFNRVKDNLVYKLNIVQFVVLPLPKIKN